MHAMFHWNIELWVLLGITFFPVIAFLSALLYVFLAPAVVPADKPLNIRQSNHCPEPSFKGENE